MSNNINISPKLKLANFTLPSNSFYGDAGSVKPTNSATFNSVATPSSSTSNWKTVFTQSSSRTIIEETFLKQSEPLSPKRRNSTDYLLSLPLNPINMEISGRRSNRSTSPDWATCRFSLPAVKKNEEHENKGRKRRSISKEEDEVSSKKENRYRSISPDWNTSRFSLPPLTPRSTSSPSRKTKASPLVSGNSASRNSRSSRSASPDWNTSKFSLPKASVEALKHKKIATASPRITAHMAYRYKTKIKKSTMYTISQKTLDKLLPKPEIHLFDVVKYGPTPQHKDDFLFGLNLMRSEVLNKIDLLHYKKKLRNTGMNFIQTFQQPKKSRSKTQKSEPDASNSSKKIEEHTEPIVSIEIPDQPDEIIIDDVDTTAEVNATDEIDEPDEVIQIDDDDDDKEVDKESEKLLEEAIQDFADKFGSEIVDEITEKSNVIDSNVDHSILNNVNGNGNGNDAVKDTVKMSETNIFYHSVTKKRNRNSLDSKTDSKTSIHNQKRNSLPNIKIIKKNGIPKKKSLPNKKKNIIKVKWPIARKSLLDLRNNI